MKKFLFLLLISSASLAQSTQKSTLLNDLSVLSHDSLQGRRTGSAGIKKAADYIASRYKEIGLSTFESGLYQPFKVWSGKDNDSLSAKNIIGYIKGSKSPEKYIIITAHYDHLGQIGDKIFNGADDNASGVGGLLELAKKFSKQKPKNTIIFVAFDAEEMGLKGAYYFVKNLPVKKENILLNLNMDMVSRNAKKEIYICGTFYNPNLKTILAEAASSKLVNIKYGHDNPAIWKNSEDWTFSSDHGPFYKQGIPFLYYGVEDHEDYHRDTDDYSKIDEAFYTSVVEQISNHAKFLDKKL